MYRLDAAGQETVLYSFTGPTDGLNPMAGVILDSAGNLYGTTVGGGTPNAGTVYMLDATHDETVLYSFRSYFDGSTPLAGVIRDPTGNLYGTTIYSGTAGYGVVYEVDTAGQETVLYSFTGGADGGYPNAGVIRDSAGNLYGTTNKGGDLNCNYGNGCGVVYKLDTTGQETVLHSFTGQADGGYPSGSLIRDSAGNLYGTTSNGGIVPYGTVGYGVVYELDAAGQETVLYSFMGGDDGAYPSGGVIRDSAGNLYGATSLGGTASVRRGVQAGYGRAGDGGVHLHGRSRWGRTQ